MVLVEHLIFGKHRRYIARERRHVVQAQRLEIGRRQHRQHAGDGLGLRRVDLLDAGMGMRGTVEVAVQHAGQLHVVDVIALALNEADVLDALSLAAHALQTFGALFGGRVFDRSFCCLLKR